MNKNVLIFRPVASEKIWVSKNGRETKISDLHWNHLLNIVKEISENKTNAAQDLIDAILGEYNFRSLDKKTNKIAKKQEPTNVKPEANGLFFA